MAIISDTTLGSAASSIAVSVDTYTKFRVTVFAIKDGTAGSVSVRLNADSGANYAYQELKAVNAAVSAARATGQTSFIVNQAIGASQVALFTFEITKPLTTTPARFTNSSSIMDNAGTPAIELFKVSGEWANTADLITAITVLASVGDFAAGTRVIVEGV